MKLPAQVFHLAEAANWRSIQQYGLLSTSALLDLAGVRGEEGARFEREHRPTHTELPNGVQIRDQKPMPPQALARCLIGMSPAEWYQLINSKVFFWLDPDRLDRQRRACEPRPQVVLIVDTQSLLARHAEGGGSVTHQYRELTPQAGRAGMEHVRALRGLVGVRMVQ